jgi:C4-dicarboxylate transporter DctM subunit
MIITLFITLAVTLLMGIPVAFSIGMSTMLALFVGGDIPIVIMAQKMVDGLNSFTMMALPLFILSGAIMVYGSTPRIMNLANMLLRKKRWGLGNAGIIGCAAFGTISGSGVATTAAVGSIIAPEMVKQGYSPGFAGAVVAGAGTLGSIIPPSIMFVVYAQVANVSISDMFLAGFIPGILTALFLCILNRYMVVRNGWCASNEQRVHYETLSRKEKWGIAIAAVPPLFMPIIILGGVLSGIATPTEAASIACVYALILSMFVYKAMSLKDFVLVLVESSVASATILLIISAATPMAWLLTMQNVTTLLAEWVMGISNNVILVYGIILVILLVMGTFMETIAIILLTVPIFLPILLQYGIDPVAFGITTGLALCIGAVTPPLAVCLFTSCRILKIRVEDTVPDVFYVCGAMLAATMLTAIFPALSTFLPDLLR